MKTCVGCGKEILANKKYCRHCGTAQTPITTVTSSPSSGTNLTAEAPTRSAADGTPTKRTGRIVPLIAAIILIIGAAAVGIFTVLDLGSGDHESTPVAAKTDEATPTPPPVEATPPEPVSALPSDCPVAAFEADYELITSDRTDTTLSCGVGIPNSGIGVWSNYEIMAPELWDVKSQEFVAEGAQPFSLELGETAAFTLEIQGMDGPETSYLIYSHGVVLSMIAQVVEPVEIAVQAIPAR
jgi:hypothetical protein